MSHVLTLNAGSSSLKFGLFRVAEAPEPEVSGEVEGIGTTPRLTLAAASGARREEPLPPEASADHGAALSAALAVLAEAVPGAEVRAVGHRIVHGGADHAGPVVLTPETLAGLEALVPLAPLHQPQNLAGVRAAQAAFPQAVQVGCFDTAFHRGQAFAEETYALPRRFHEAGIRRYGFHGLNYEHIAGVLAAEAPALHAGRVVAAHLGNGASLCALRSGRSIASTMGFTALDGLPMGTRCGQIDPGVLLYLLEREGMTVEALSDLLWRRSGLLGLSGLSQDMRVLEASESPAAESAIEVFVSRVCREIGALAAVLEGLDGIVFSGGIGENSARIRAEVCRRLAWAGVSLDAGANAAHARRVSSEASRVTVLVVPADEERVIARATAALAGTSRPLTFH